MDLYEPICALINDKDLFNNTDFINFFIHNISDVIPYLESENDNLIISVPHPDIKKKLLKFKEIVNKDSVILYKQYLQSLVQKDVQIIIYGDPDYPPQLYSISDPPLLLYRKGTLKWIHNAVAIVGTRAPSEFGLYQAGLIGAHLSGLGYSVVSGLARGIDSAAHRGALSVNGNTIAILPGDIDTIYPPEHVDLAINVSGSGALLSEVSFFTKLHKGRFLLRNRLTSGVSSCVVVIESHGGGGTLQQVKTALKQGKKVFSLVPGEEGAGGKGFEELIRIGATPFSSYLEISEWLQHHPPTHVYPLSHTNKAISLSDFL